MCHLYNSFVSDHSLESRHHINRLGSECCVQERYILNASNQMHVADIFFPYAFGNKAGGTSNPTGIPAAREASGNLLTSPPPNPPKPPPNPPPWSSCWVSVALSSISFLNSNSLSRVYSRRLRNEIMRLLLDIIFTGTHFQIFFFFVCPLLNFWSHTTCKEKTSIWLILFSMNCWSLHLVNLIQ